MQTKYMNSLPIFEKKELIDRVVNEALARQYKGFNILGINKSWRGNELSVFFVIKKSFIEREVRGKINVSDSSIAINVEVPEIVKNFVKEEKIIQVITEELDAVFAQ